MCVYVHKQKILPTISLYIQNQSLNFSFHRPLVNVHTFFKVTWNLYCKDNADLLETNCDHTINLPKQICAAYSQWGINMYTKFLLPRNISVLRIWCFSAGIFSSTTVLKYSWYKVLLLNQPLTFSFQQHSVSTVTSRDSHVLFN